MNRLDAYLNYSTKSSSQNSETYLLAICAIATRDASHALLTNKENNYIRNNNHFSN